MFKRDGRIVVLVGYDVSAAAAAAVYGETNREPSIDGEVGTILSVSGHFIEVRLDNVKSPADEGLWYFLDDEIENIA